MARRPEPPPKPPFWHRSRLTWVNALGFALTLFLGIFLLLAGFSNVMPKSDPIRFEIPTAFAAVLVLAQLATVGLGAVVVFGFMMRGADFHTHKPRLYVFWWTCAGFLFFLVDMISLVKFGMSDLPNAARWSEHLYWGVAPVGLLCFGLMGYVNIDIPADDEDEHHDDDHYDDEHYDEEHHDDEQYAEEHA